MTKRRVSFWLGILLLLLLSIAGWCFFHTWPNVSGIRSVSAGGRHSLVLLADGRVWGWGSNSDNQLVSGASSFGLIPTQISDLNTLCAIEAGLSHTVALDTSGAVWWWGSNNGFDISYYFNRGDDFRISSVEPAIVAKLANIVMISAGDHHDLALDDHGTIWAWGRNGYGQLGDGTTNAAKDPVQVEGLDHVISISAGAAHSLAARSDGTVWGWGDNTLNQLGPERPSEVLIPSQIEGLENIVQVSGGFGHSIALAEDGRVWTWSLIDRPESLTNTGVDQHHHTLTSLRFDSPVISIDTGAGNSVVLLDNGQVWTWGSNDAGQLGNNTLTPSPEPIQIMGLSHIVLIAAGKSHNIAVDENGSLWGWGLDEDMQIGWSSFVDLPYRNPEALNYVLEPRKILNNIETVGPEIACP